MKHTYKLHCAAILLSLFLAVMLALPALAAAAESTGQVLYVTGKGGVHAKPDVAYISAEVSTKHDDAQTAQAENNLKITTLIKSLGAIGIAAEDITTSSYKLSPNRYYDYNQEKYVEDGYTASCTMRIAVKDLDRVGTAVNGAVAAGVSKVSNIQFALSDTSPYYAQALAAAARDAQTKADALSGALGVKITAVLVVEEQSTYYAPVSYDSAPLSSLEEDVVSEALVPLMPVQADEISVTATVKVTYEIQ